ncbi:MAG: hypothetical protein LBM98_09645 [Oscillospiraceae bacterium]|nr:hypothetical protein [Oscillospiraceae bacterium]
MYEYPTGYYPGEASLAPTSRNVCLIPPQPHVQTKKAPLFRGGCRPQAAGGAATPSKPPSLIVDI